VNRRAWSAFGTVSCLLLLCSCTADAGGAADPTDAATEAAEFSGDLTAWFLDPGSAPARVALESAVAAFEAEHPAVSITVEYVPAGEAKKRLTAAIGAATAPDLAQTSAAWTAELAELGVLAPAAPADVEYVDSLVEASAVDGTSFGYPWYGRTQALIYRSDILSEAGVSAPTTWEDVFTVGDAIAAQVPDIAPMHVAGGHLDLQAPLIWAAGGDVATEVAGRWRSGIDSPEGREAFSHFESVWKKGWSPPDALTWGPNDVVTAFADGRSAMMIGGLADLRTALAANPRLAGQLGTALLPAGPAGVRDAVASGTHLVVLDGSTQQDAAVALARHLTRPEQIVPFADAVDALAGTREGVEAAVVDDEALAAFGEQLVEHSRTYPATAWWRQVVRAGDFEAATQQLMQGQMTAHEAAAQVDAAVRRAIG
jgi:N,N'-diacetylchitobiose transport system substrate-binding protein